MDSLSPLSDYVFLSDPLRSETYCVERSGRVRLWQEGEAPGEPELRKSAILPYLFDWTDHLAGPTSWCWEDGYLPILIMNNSEGHTLKLLPAADGTLLLSSPDGKTRIFPVGESVDDSVFQHESESLRRRWTKWFEACPRPANACGNVWKSCLVQAKSAMWGMQLKYGVEKYGEFRADAFPPTLISLAETLSLYGHVDEAYDLVLSYLERYVMADGRIDYYGTAISEYGDLLRLVALLGRREEGGKEFFCNAHPYLTRILNNLIRALNLWTTPGKSPFGLICGVPEADTRDCPDEYLHCNLAVLRGFMEYLDVWRQYDTILPNGVLELRHITGVLRRRLEFACRHLAVTAPFLPCRLGQAAPFASFRESLESAYANYRYYPEILQSGLLPFVEARKIIDARLTREGEEYGMTVFSWPGATPRYDNWPIAAYGKGLLEYGEMELYSRVLNGHLAHHMTPDTFTAYESVQSVANKDNVRGAGSDWCIPAQLVYPLLLRLPETFHPFTEKLDLQRST